MLTTTKYTIPKPEATDNVDAVAHISNAHDIIDTWLGRYKPTIVNLADAATITPDVSAGALFRCTLGGNRTVAAPLNPYDGQEIAFEWKQDGTGTRTLTYNAVFRFSTTWPNGTLTTTVAKKDLQRWRYHLADNKWDMIHFVKGV